MFGVYLPIGILCLLLMVALLAIVFIGMAIWNKYGRKEKAKIDLDSEREAAQIELLKKIKAQNAGDDSILNENGNVKWTRYAAATKNFQVQRV